jgi:seryl-tRNA synthetase
MKAKQFTLKMNEDAIAELDRLHEESGNTNKGVTLASIIMKPQVKEKPEKSENLPVVNPEQIKKTPEETAEIQKLSETIRVLSEQVQTLSAKKPEEIAPETETEENAESPNLSADLREIAESFKSLSEENPEQAEDFQEFAETFQNLSVNTPKLDSFEEENEFSTLPIFDKVVEIKRLIAEFSEEKDKEKALEKIQRLEKEHKRLLSLFAGAQAYAVKNDMTISELLWHVFGKYANNSWSFDLERIGSNEHNEIVRRFNSDE